MSDVSAPRVGASRRRVLLSGVGGVGGLVGAAVLGGCTRADSPDSQGAVARAARAVARDFRGTRQSGIVDPPQPYAAFVALDLVGRPDREAVRRLLTVWTDDIDRLMAGRGTLVDQEPELAAVPAGLTVTVGVGPRVVRAARAEAPTWLAPLPAYGIDRLEPGWSGGDFILQVCAHSPTTVAHAVRKLVTAAPEVVSVRWVQRGFREPHEGPGVPMRNLFGQVDGTVQPAVDGPDDSLLFVGATGPDWLREGSAMVVRRIAMNLDSWDRVDRSARENAIGRRLSDGAPVARLTGTGTGSDAALDGADLEATNALGFPVIDDAAHLRRAHASAPHERFLRRPYSYDDAPATGAVSSSGLIFVAYCADPVRQFAPVQARLAEKDLLNLWTTPIGSAVFAVLPGARDGAILGEAMLA